MEGRMINSTGVMGNSAPNGLVRTIGARRKVIQIPPDIHKQLIDHAVADLPNEACGFLAGAGDVVAAYYPVRNEDASGFTYYMEGGDRFRAEMAIEDAGQEVVGIFHSHTHTEAYPSNTDRERAYWKDPVTGERAAIYPGARYVIASARDGADPMIRAFRILLDGVEEEEVNVV
jgi:[CysO sulfur-carrier protein]-S-L-cysteine hydrolase